MAKNKEKKEPKNPTIDDLLNSLQNPVARKVLKDLINNTSTWTRIGQKDSFTELNLESSELTDFLKEWINDNPYNNI
jgi:hypothetical protein